MGRDIFKVFEKDLTRHINCKMINPKVILIILKYNVLNGLRHITMRLFNSWVAEKTRTRYAQWGELISERAFISHASAIFTSYCFNFQTVI